MFVRRKSGFTPVQILLAIVLVLILTRYTMQAGDTQVTRANRESETNTMQVLAGNLSDAYYDLGNPVFELDDEGKTAFQRFISIVAEDYLGCSFDMSTLQTTDKGYSLEMISPLDTYGMQYKCFFVTTESAGSRYAIIASGGDDGIINSDGYSSDDFGDDIVLIVKPKV